MEINENDKMTSDVFGEKVKKIKFVLKKKISFDLKLQQTK
jgi:hypothetical protein